MDMRLFVDIQNGIEIMNGDHDQIDKSIITQLLFSFSDHQKGNEFDVSFIFGFLYRSLFY